MERYDGTEWYKETLGDATAGLLMDAATSDVVSVGVSMLPVVLSTDGGKTYVTSDAIQGISQSATVFPPDSGEQIGLVGSFSTGKGEPFVSGVAHSANRGETWTVSAVSGGDVRYGAFPSSDTWYVSAGMWGADAIAPGASTGSLSSRLSFHQHEDHTYHLHEHAFNATAAASSLKDENGWWGKIFKTSDAGATWENVFSSGADDHYYFNNIACATNERCVAVTEGDAKDDFRAYVTQDGGQTWTNTLSNAVKPDDQVSLMGAGWVSDMEGWVAGTSKSGINLVGLFFKTVDGGASWTLEQELNNCFPIDMAMAANGKVGLAACLSSSGGSATIATLEQ
mmetsp:Transcript_7565/g.12721  ORF Transcript_7565/g.12721 Transcript_7565/m.12721 type:complete len:339 (+) Transcript_7565:49-1065(+)